MNETLKELRQSNVEWILKWMLASGKVEVEIQIDTFPGYVKFYAKEANRTVVLNTKETYHLIHFIDGTQGEFDNYFSMEIGFSQVVTAPPEMILQFLTKGLTRDQMVELRDHLDKLKD